MRICLSPASADTLKISRRQYNSDEGLVLHVYIATLYFMEVGTKLVMDSPSSGATSR